MLTLGWHGILKMQHSLKTFGWLKYCDPPLDGNNFLQKILLESKHDFISNFKYVSQMSDFMESII